MNDLQKFDEEQKKIISEILKRNNSSSSVSSNKTCKENVSITYKCTKTHRVFDIIYGRENYNEKYIQLKVIKDVDTKTFSVMDKQSNTTSSLNIDINQFELDGFHCPYCNSKEFCKCSCGKLICSGAIEKQNNEDYLRCTWCGVRNIIKGKIDRLHASNHKENINKSIAGIKYKEIGASNYKSLPE
jgi:DNA-directed RNA polymerase subunit RPC12/RpoP